TPTGGATASGDNDYAGETLTVLVYENDESAMGKAWREAAKIFEEETGATVDYQITSFEDLSDTASQLFVSSDAPDLSEYNKGNGTAGALSTLGVLQNLDGFFESYGWDDKLSGSLQTTTKYDDNRVHGDGVHYLLPNCVQHLV